MFSFEALLLQILRQLVKFLPPSILVCNIYLKESSNSLDVCQDVDKPIFCKSIIASNSTLLNHTFAEIWHNSGKVKYGDGDYKWYHRGTNLIKLVPLLANKFQVLGDKILHKNVQV